MKTIQEIEIEKEYDLKGKKEAIRLVNTFGKILALEVCQEFIKVLPNINDTPPVSRKSIDNYYQFYMFRVTNEINKIK
jgi:hypothetical protein